uniref:hypothetical protein n=1 Tax=Streptococcus sobrinus TaxID=1310 RepID=UPI0026E99062
KLSLPRISTFPVAAVSLVVAASPAAVAAVDSGPSSQVTIVEILPLSSQPLGWLFVSSRLFWGLLLPSYPLVVVEPYVAIYLR